MGRRVRVAADVSNERLSAVTRVPAGAFSGDVQPRAEPTDGAGGRPTPGDAAGTTAANRPGATRGTGGRERRRYARLAAPILCRPDPFVESVPRRVIDVSLGGARVYSDIRRRPGERLEVEFFPPEAEPFVVRATVVWVQAVAPGGAALYDVGLKFIGGLPTDDARMHAVMDQARRI